MNERMNEWINQSINQWTYEWMNEWMNEYMNEPVVEFRLLVEAEISSSAFPTPGLNKNKYFMYIIFKQIFSLSNFNNAHKKSYGTCHGHFWK